MESKSISDNEDSSAGIDLQTKHLIENLMPLAKATSTYVPSSFSSSQAQIKPKVKKGNFTNEEKQIINDTICQYALDKNLSREKILAEFISINDSASNFSLKDKNYDSLWFRLSKALPGRSLISIYKNFIKRYFHNNENESEIFNFIENENSKNDARKFSDPKRMKEDASHSPHQGLGLVEEEGGRLSLGVIGSDLKKISSSPLYNQMTMIKSVQYFLDNKEKEELKVNLLLKNSYEFVPLNSLEDEEYKIDTINKKIFINEKLKESKSHLINTFFILTICDFNTLLKIHSEKEKFALKWEEITQIYNHLIKEENKNSNENIKNINEENSEFIESEWDNLLREYKIDEINHISEDRQLIKE